MKGKKRRAEGPPVPPSVPPNAQLRFAIAEPRGRYAVDVDSGDNPLPISGEQLRGDNVHRLVELQCYLVMCQIRADADTENKADELLAKISAADPLADLKRAG